MRFHDRRHTAATLLLRERVDPHRVQRLLRHRDVKTTTGTYGHLVVEDLRDAINLLPPSPFAASLLEDPEVDACSRAEFDDRERGDSGIWIGAGNGSRTRDPQLGKLMLYQLSYSRSGLRRLVGAPGRVKDYSTLSEYACVALASLFRGLETSTA